MAVPLHPIVGFFIWRKGFMAKQKDQKPDNTPGPDKIQNPGQEGTGTMPLQGDDTQNVDPGSLTGTVPAHVMEKGLNNRLAAYDDRMKRYTKVNACPECKAFPVICTMRRQGYASFRCRECGHRWEITVEAQSSKEKAA
jgi:hypothetical protein